MAATSEWVFDVTEADFEQKVILQSKERPVVVDFWAPWCGPCRSLGPLLEQLVAERQGSVVLAKVNVDEAQNLAMEFGIESIPAVKAIRDGRIVFEFVGLLSEPQLREFLDRIGPTETDKLARQAAELEKTNPDQAEKLYRQILEKERDQPAALVGLARVLIARGQTAEVEELLERVNPGSEQAEEVERLRGVMTLAELARGLPDEAKPARPGGQGARQCRGPFSAGQRPGGGGKISRGPRIVLAGRGTRSSAGPLQGERDDGEDIPYHRRPQRPGRRLPGQTDAHPLLRKKPTVGQPWAFRD